MTQRGKLNLAQLLHFGRGLALRRLCVERKPHYVRSANANNFCIKGYIVVDCMQCKGQRATCKAEGHVLCNYFRRRSTCKQFKIPGAKFKLFVCFTLAILANTSSMWVRKGGAYIYAYNVTLLTLYLPVGE